ncbi:reverse transcriptase domain-containing protein [Tanacetum coccineum]
MIIEAEIGGYCIHRIYVDGGSALKILYEHCFNQLRPKIKNQLVPATTSLIGFSGEIIWPIGKIQLLVRIGDKEHSASAWMNFVVVRSPSPYNGIIKRTRVRKLQAVPSTAHGMLKLLVEGGVITLKSSRLVLLECALVSRPKEISQAPKPIVEERVKEEVGKLVEAGIMKEVHYHDWLSNPVMVKKHDDNWRMCLDFKDLNKACPKDGYPLPEIDWKVESLCGFPFKCFLHAYKGYHQIQMAKEDEEKIAFITSQGIFCYTKMPFGLRNAGATYQRLVDKAFDKQIGRNLEVEINMKLNPKKCTFGVEEGMFLGYKVNTKGLNVCPDKVDAVLCLPSPKCLKDVQKLNGKLASLNRFLAKSAEKSLPFFKNLKKCTKKSDFYWTTEAKEAFKQMKQLIAELPMLTSPMEKEELIVYLEAAKETVSAVLMTEREAKQMPIDFVSRALRGSEINYTSMEKLVLALVHASKCLKRHFQAHPIIVIMDQPIQQVLSRPKVAGRLLKRSIELGEYAIHYRHRISVKGQILADFIVERPEEDSLDTLMEVEEELPKPWILFTDGPSCIDGYRAELILTNPEGMEFTYALRFKFKATNNKAEYEALIAGLRIAEQIGEEIKARLDARSKNWIEELPYVLWAHRTMIKYSNGDTLFSLTYGIEAVIPAKIGMPTLRITEVDLVQNNEALGINLDLLEERREEKAIHLVYRNNDASRTEDTGKLGPKWEGPHEVTEALRNGAYKLRDRDGKQLPRT